MILATYKGQTVRVLRKSTKNCRITTDLTQATTPNGTHVQASFLVPTTELIFHAIKKEKKSARKKEGYSQWNEAAPWVRRAEEGWGPGGF